MDRQAKARGITRTGFLVDSALNRLPEHHASPDDLEDRLLEQLDEYDKRLERLETFAGYR